MTWALDHAIELNPGGINGPSQIAILTRDDGNLLSARLLDDYEVAEHLNSVRGAESHLALYRDVLAGKIQADAPPPPTPPQTS